MGFKKDEFGNRIFSEKQMAVLLYGQRLRGMGSVSELIKHLKALGNYELAAKVEGAVYWLKVEAKLEYEKERLRLDPNYKSPFNKLMDDLLAQDEVM